MVNQLLGPRDPKRYPNEMFSLPGDFRWLAPWSALDDDADPCALECGQMQADIESGGTVGTGLVAELRREMPAGHRLANCNLCVVGRCDVDHNEFLFATDDPEIALACVHLTWRVETNPMWPYTYTYASAEAWAAQMQCEHDGLIATRRQN